MNAIIGLSEKQVRLSRNEFLTTAGKVDTNAYYVEQGSLRVFVEDGGEERTIRFGYQGNIVVPLDSFLTGAPTRFYIQAIKKSLIRVITKSQIEEFLKNDENKTTWIAVLENLIVQQLEREVDILTSSPMERYQRVLERSPQLFQQIPNKYIANYLRMTPETLSRLQKP